MNDPDVQIYKSPDASGKANPAPDQPKQVQEEPVMMAVTRFIFKSSPGEFYRTPNITLVNASDSVAKASIVSSDVSGFDDTPGFTGNLNTLNLENGFTEDMTLVMDVGYICSGTEGSTTFSFSLDVLSYNSTTPQEEAIYLISDRLDSVSAQGTIKQYFAKKETVTFQWKKKCGPQGTLHTGVNAVFEDANTIIENGAVASEFSYSESHESTYTVRGDDDSSVVSMFATLGTSFAWGTPKVGVLELAKDEKVSVRLGGALAREGYVHSEEQGDLPNLVISYDECKAERAVIRLTWDIIGFNPVSFDFIKRCGSKVHSGLAIKMNSVSGVYDVVSGGAALGDFASGKFLVSSTAQTVTFWVSTLGEPVTVSRVFVSQTPTTFHSSLAGPMSTKESHTITDTSSVDLIFDCSIQGTSKVTVTFALDDYDPVDVMFTKQCTPKVAKLKAKQSVDNSSSGTSWLAM